MGADLFYLSKYILQHDTLIVTDALRTVVDKEIWIACYNERLSINVKPMRIFIDKEVLNNKTILGMNKHYYPRESTLAHILKDYMLAESASGNLIKSKKVSISTQQKVEYYYVFGFTKEECQLNYAKEVVKEIPHEELREKIKLYDESLSLIEK